MSKLIKISSLLAVLAMVVSPAAAMAQTAETTDTEPLAEAIAQAANEAGVIEEVIIDEMVSPEELDVEEPTLLPDSKFYFLKNWGRGIRSIFTRNPVKKAELKLKYASEKLLEARKLADKNKRPEILTKAAENFQQEMERVKGAVDKIKDTANSSPKVGKFLDKFVKHQILHQKILDKIEEKVPEGALEKIQAVRETHLEKFGEVMEKLEDKAQIKARIKNAVKQLEGSKFKEIKEMEILKRFEERAPQEVKERMMEAREAMLDNLKEKIEKMEPQIRERIGDYVEKIKGAETGKMEILEDIKGKIQLRPDIKENLESAQAKVIERVRAVAENQGLQCAIAEIAPRDCSGRVIIERNEDGCPIPRCVEVTEDTSEVAPTAPTQGSAGQIRGRVQQVCTTLFNPVCGVNGKTYGNTCRAKAAGVEVKYKGACKQKLIRQQMKENLTTTPESETNTGSNAGESGTNETNSTPTNQQKKAGQ